ncbi:endonuclease domain-containing protein [Flaviflagellibacter deserti]|uniref:Endonuclease domain-containing protein n=1 Tax=Flaviflagellibacter deserti TaxID=2267266 RepID=A0ABV9YYI4_9HYPH
MSVPFARSLRKRMTPPEVRLRVRLRELRARGFHFRRQAPRLGYVLDFVCLKAGLVIEVDGDTHAMGTAPARDAIRDARLREEGMRVFRVTNAEVMENPDGVMEAILAELGH